MSPRPLAQVVSESSFQAGPDVRLAGIGPRQKNGRRRCLRTANALRVVMRHFRAAPRLRQDIIERLAGDADRARPHRRAIAPAPVRLAPALPGPLDERPTVAGVRAGMEVGVKLIDVVTAVEQPRRNRDRQHGVVGEPALRNEERKVLRLRGGSFVNRADDVTANGTNHGEPADLSKPDA